MVVFCVCRCRRRSRAWQCRRVGSPHGCGPRRSPLTYALGYADQRGLMCIYRDGLEHIRIDTRKCSKCLVVDVETSKRLLLLVYRAPGHGTTEGLT